MSKKELSTQVRKKIETVRKYEWGLLELRNCGLSEIPEEILEMSYLVNLDLGNDDFCDDNLRNKVTVIPDSIINLKNLSKLDLSNNRVAEVSEKITSLKTLQHLNLTGNRLTDFSAKIANMPALKQLKLDDNPFEMIPPEIIARGIQSIRNFFIELEEKDFLYETKLIIVGEGRVGKTCLTKALTDPDFKLTEEESTEGININRWIINNSEVRRFNSKIQRDLQINIWDFGGQEIYHSTHQFFLTKRSLYLLVTESRKEDRHDDFFYWLNIIKLLGDQSPVILVMNKCDQPVKELPVKEYTEAFKNIIDFSKISLKEGYSETLDNFKDIVKRVSANLPHIGNPLPKKWVDIRIEIEELKLAGRSYISQDEYFEICKNHYRRMESALFLSEYFHDLGVILHFQKDIDLKDTVFLNHEWITKGVYKIFDDRKVLEQSGKFDLEDINRIWFEPEYKEKSRELLSLMKNRKFDLCFEIDTGRYLIPRLLPVDEIDHKWVSTPENLKFEIYYKFMPKGILARLIVKMNRDILDNMYWRYGVILDYMDTRAIVREKYFENKITIELEGQYKREFLFMIRKAINEIHGDFNQLQFSEMIPCVCDTCKRIDYPHFYSFDLLLRYELKDKKSITCEKSLEDVNVLHLTSDVIRGRLSNDRMIVCENRNEDLLKLLDLPNTIFFAEKDSSSVFMQVKTRPQIYGLRDRDYLIDSEIVKIREKYPNYYILGYYCLENYLFHPDNIAELNLDGFIKQDYVNEIIQQKNQKKNDIILGFIKSRDSYQEFKIEHEKLRIKADENSIFSYLESDDIDVFFKAFSMKTYFNKSSISKYNLQPKELARTTWFKEQIKQLLN